MASTHSKLCQLPIELQLHIWNYALGQRVLTVSAGSATKNSAGLKITQICPAALHICQHSRYLFLERYGSVFSPTKASVWAGDTYNRFLRIVMHVLRPYSDTAYLSAPSKRTRKNNRNRIIELNKYLESPKLDKKGTAMTSKFAATNDGALARIWFDNTQDIVLFKYPASTIGMWAPWTDEEQLKIQHVAFETSEMFPHNHWTVTSTELWAIMNPPAKNIWRGAEGISKNLQTASVIARGWEEVYVITINKTNSLQPGQWSYWLDTTSRTFESEMGDSWANVTWRIEIANIVGMSLWDIWVAWKGDMVPWTASQCQVCTNASEVKETWWNATPRAHWKQAYKKSTGRFNPPRVGGFQGRGRRNHLSRIQQSVIVRTRTWRVEDARIPTTCGVWSCTDSIETFYYHEQTRRFKFVSDKK